MNTLQTLIEKSEVAYVAFLREIIEDDPHLEVEDEHLWQIAEYVLPRDAMKLVNALYNAEHDFSNGYLHIEDWKHYHRVMPSPKPDLISPYDLTCYLARQFLVSALRSRRNAGEESWRAKMKTELSPEDFAQMPFYLPAPEDAEEREDNS